MGLQDYYLLSTVNTLTDVAKHLFSPRARPAAATSHMMGLKYSVHLNYSIMNGLSYSGLRPMGYRSRIWV
jgi:hypothetical protein